MAALTNQIIKNSFGDLLQVSNANDGIDSTLRSISDGKGGDCPLQLSTTGVNVVSGFTYNGKALTFNGAFTISNSHTIALDSGEAVTVTIPNSLLGSGAVTLATVSETQTLINKTLTAPIIATISNTGTITLPTTTTTLVGRNTTDTLTNKTLTSPVLTTPTLGVATATTLNGVTISSTSGTLTIANSKTLTCSNTLTFTGTDSSSVAFGAGGTVSYITAASASDQETGTSTTLAVTPAVQQRHKSSPKAWVIFNGTGTVAISDSYNVSSITDNATGDYTVNFTTAFSSSSYCAVLSAGASATSNVTLAAKDISTAPTTSAYRLKTMQTTSFTFTDLPFVYASFFGDQ